MNTPEFEGLTAVLTGASGRLGSEIARAFWRRGASLMLSARSEETLRPLRDELLPAARAGQELDIAAADLADPSAPRRILSRAESLWPRLDVLVNNAAVQGPIGPFWKNPEKEWRLAFLIDFLAPAELCRLALPRMIARRRGKIINISGGGAASARPRFSAYAAAKAALVRFSETIAREVEEHNVQVNCIAPGAMDTGMNRAILRAGSEEAGEEEFRRARRLADAGESSAGRAAELCCFLASRAGDGITGRLISARWDPWPTLGKRGGELRKSDIYTLRRIVPRDRGKDWD